MTDYRDIRPLSPAERTERTAHRRAKQEMAHQRILEQLDDWEWDCEKGGRPPIVLPSEIARRVLADLEAGYSDRAIVKKYAGTPWSFSTYWLAEAKKDGRLLQMAGIRGLVQENLSENGPVLTAI